MSFKITEPGLYVTRSGDIVEILRKERNSWHGNFILNNSKRDDVRRWIAEKIHNKAVDTINCWPAGTRPRAVEYPHDIIGKYYPVLPEDRPRYFVEL